MTTFIWLWVTAIAACFIIRKWVQNRSDELGLFLFFLGLGLIGVGFVLVSVYWLYVAMQNGNMVQAILNAIVLVIGLVIAWISAKPLSQLTIGFMKRTK